MIEKIIDLHIHSKFARACSKDLELPKIAKVCEEKGINIVSTGDFTHPGWFSLIKKELKEDGGGLLSLKNSESRTKFIIGTEISCIYKHRDKVRRIHLLIFVPSLEIAERFNKKLEEHGVNLRSDGRPMMGLTAKNIVEICLGIDKRIVVIPAHAWTPWYAVFGSKSGYDSLEECFEELTPNIFAIETGLSSDPTMNRRISKLDKIALVSNSDAHSLQNLGREANVIAFKNENEVSYDSLWKKIRSGDKKQFLYTIEFYPEEGMYYHDGHKTCNVSLKPSETIHCKEICPVCKKKLTVGVLNRIEKLADRSENKILGKFISHRYIVPLREIIANAFEVGKASKKVELEYRNMLLKLGSEFSVLLYEDLAKIDKIVSDKNITLGIKNMRSGLVNVTPGYDGVYGKISVLENGKKVRKTN
ncbi:MAG: endonuclease Q family protein [Patescibacteria group bacterium]|jgi:uncharacterized protein (TIGR00375 family)